MTEVYVVQANSESGDEFGPFVFEEEPTEAVLLNLVITECDWSGGGGPGIFDSYTHLQVKRVPIRKVS